MRASQNLTTYLTFIIILLIATIPVFLYFDKYVHWSGKFSDSLDDWSRLGDFWAGTVGPILSFGTIVLLLIQLRLQRQDMAEIINSNEENLKIQKQLAILPDAKAQLKLGQASLEHLWSLHFGGKNFYPKISLNNFFDDDNERQQFLSNIRNEGTDSPPYSSVEEAIVEHLKKMSRKFNNMVKIIKSLQKCQTEEYLYKSNLEGSAILATTFYENYHSLLSAAQKDDILFIHNTYWDESLGLSERYSKKEILNS